MSESIDRRTFFKRHAFPLIAGSVLVATGGVATLAEEIIRRNANGDGIREATDKGTPPQNEILRKRGLLGEHELIDLRDVAGFNISGNVSGGFFAFNGSLDGRSIELLQFAWKTNTETPLIIISAIPTDQIIIRNPVGNSSLYPTINFDFVMKKILTYKVNDEWWGNDLSPKTFDSDNPNDFLTGGKVSRANITMTTAQLTKFRSQN